MIRVNQSLWKTEAEGAYSGFVSQFEEEGTDMSLEELFRRVRADERSRVSGREVSESALSELEGRHNICLPETYRRFLLEFGEGGEFVFARMRLLEEDERIASFWDYWGARLGEDSRSKYFPFGDDYAGNYYCFELAKATETDSPIVLVDDLLEDCPEDAERAESFSALITMALDGSGIFDEG